MQIQTGNINYRNDNGEAVSKEEFDILRDKFQKDVDNAYNEKANQIISIINSEATSDTDKLWMLFNYLSSENMVYDLQGRTLDGRNATHPGYNFAPYKTYLIPQKTKYPALLNNSGVCITFSLAFEDLANRLGIPCRVVNGDTGMEHAWNVVLINNQLMQIDVTYAIINRRINNKKDFFLKTVLPNRTVSSNLSDLESDMREQYAKEHPQNAKEHPQNVKEHPQIKIHSRTDKPTIKIISRTDKPTIKIISRTDDNDEEPKITIHKK